MNKLTDNLACAAKNLHISLPVALAVACELGKIWLPHYADKIDDTKDALMLYGIISAANSSAKPQQPTESK